MRIALYRTLSLRYLQQRWTRALLVVASIALGVATMVATRSLNQSMTAAAQSTSRPMAGTADLLVSNGDLGVRLDLKSEIAEVPGVRAVMPLLIERVTVPELDNRRAVLVGVDLAFDNLQSNPWGIKYSVTAPLRLWRLGKDAMFAGKELAADLAKKLPADASKFTIRAAGEAREVDIWVGTVEAAGAAGTLGGDVLYMRADTAGALVGRPGMVTRLDIALTPDADRDRVRAAIEEKLQGRALVRTPESQEESFQEAMKGLQIGFSFCGAGALVVGLFLVYNALAVSVTERRHEIGILRSVGATRSQIWLLFVGEASLLGLVGGLIGLPLGLYLSHLGLGPMQRVFSDLFVSVKSDEVTMPAGTLALAVASGVITAALAALVPALRASSEEPANAVRRRPPPTGISYQKLQISVSLALFSAGVVCILLRHQHPDLMLSHVGLVFVLVATLLTTPLLATMIASLLRPLARVAFGIEARLAADNLVRAPARTGLVIAALAAGVAMVFQTAGVIRSNEDVVLGWVDASLTADLFITSGSPVSGSDQNNPLKEEVGDELNRFDKNISSVLPVRYRKVSYKHKDDFRQVYLTALDAMGYLEANLDRPPPGADLYPLLSEDSNVPNVIISNNFSALYRVKDGDNFEVQGPDGPIELHAVGTVENYTWNLGTVIMDRARYQQLFGDSLVDAFNIYLKPDADAGPVRERMLLRYGVEHDLIVLTRAELRERISGILSRLYHIAYAQELVVGIVAALGVLTSLLISIMQRRSELGILRAIGATRMQVLVSVLAEAALMGLIGAFIGMAIGVPIEWYILRIVVFEESGFLFPVSIPWQEGLIITCLSLMIATLAGLLPALHTLGLRIPEAVAYE